MGVAERQGRQAAQHATEYAPPNHILGAGGWRRFSDRGEAARALDEDSVVAVAKIGRLAGCGSCLDCLKCGRALVVPDSPR